MPGKPAVLIEAEKLDTRIRELGAQITRDYASGNLILVGVLKGAFVFLADLARLIDLPARIDFIAVSSYGSETKSSGGGEHHQGPGPGYPGPARAHRRGHRRLGPDPGLPGAFAQKRGSRPRWRSSPCSPNRAPGRSISTSNTAGSKCRTLSWWVSAWIARRGSASSPTWGYWRRKPPATRR